MAIDKELSSEIATALLTGKERSARELNDLKETVIKVHSTLQRLASDSRESRAILEISEEPDQTNWHD